MSNQEPEDKEPFASRWSRRKVEARERPLQEEPGPKPVNAGPLPELPPVDKLGLDSDFTGFMDSRVDEALRRIALKKLFSDPRFNVRDGLDDYAENYAALEDLPADMVDQLRHARRTLRGAEADAGETAETPAGGPVIEQPADPVREAQALADAGSADDASPVPTDADASNKEINEITNKPEERLKHVDGGEDAKAVQLQQDDPA